MAAHRLAAATDTAELRAGAGWVRRAAGAATAGLAFDGATRFLAMAAGALQRAGPTADDILGHLRRTLRA